MSEEPDSVEAASRFRELRAEMQRQDGLVTICQTQGDRDGVVEAAAQLAEVKAELTALGA
jgi:hypothetical protein